jgi:hypothetical protein
VFNLEASIIILIKKLMSSDYQKKVKIFLKARLIGTLGAAQFCEIPLGSFL